jgi:periplasmic copper chaperone A
MRALPAGLPAGGYFTLHNDTTKAITLNGASSPACTSLMLHQSTDAGGMAGMQMVASMPVAAGGTLSFSPGGYHLMCMKPRLTPGTLVPVTLEFAGGLKLTSGFAVRDARGQ